MKKIFTLITLISALNANAQLWSEDFSGVAKGATSRVAGGTSGGTWSVTTAPGGTFSRQNIFLLGPVFAINNTGTEGTWKTNVLDISSVGYAIINVGVLTTGIGFTSSDYLRCYYSLDGGPEVLFSDINGSLFASTTEASAIVAGSSIQIIIRGVDNTGLGIIAFDNVSITAAPTIYSRKSGTWTDVTGGIGGTGTWSLTGHTGSACGCYPLNTQVAVIGNSHTVTLPASQTTIGTPPTTNLAPGAVDILNTGILQFNTNGVTLGIQQGLLRVRSGGTINSSSGAITGEQISFLADVGGARLQVDAGGSAAMEDLVLASGATNLHYLEGGGTLTITDDILINASDGSLTNNLTSALTVGDDIIFNSDNSDFTNNSTATVTFGGDLAANDTDDDGNEIINSAGSTLSFVNMDGLATGTGAGAYLSILNSGTINQSGTFFDIENNTNAGNDINNLNGGVWNYSGTGHDTDLRLFANNGTNTFNYFLNGAQQIITPVSTDGYSNISLQNSGSKSALANFNVYGNWSRTGSATFTPAGFTVSFRGTGAQTIAAVGGETFAGLTFNNTFATSPQITLSNPVTVTGTLTMTDGNVNLSNNNFTIGTSAASTGALSHAQNSNNGWMYGGNLIRYIGTGAIALANNQGFFPMGSSTDWRPFYMGTSGVTTGGSFTVSHTNSTTTQIVSITDASVAPTVTIVRRHDARWSISSSGVAGGTYGLLAGGTGFGTIGALADIRISLVGSVVGTHVGASGTVASPLARRDGLTLAQMANNFYISSTNATTSPLPIELVFFKASVSDNHVKLDWETASESNNDFFTIERSSDLEVFEQVLTKKGQGNSNEVNNYSAIDRSPYLGRSYYRLKQTDYDGKFTYSDVVRVDVEPGALSMKVYANPVKDKSVTVEIHGLAKYQEVPAGIYNAQGQLVYEVTLMANQSGVVLENFAFDQPAGIYILKAGRTMELTHKIMVE